MRYQLLHHAMLVGVRFEENGVERRDDWGRQFVEQGQQMAAGRPAKNSELVLERDNVHVAGVQKASGTPVRPPILLLNLEANDVRIVVAWFDVVDRHREAAALGRPHSGRM
jgi:hypothetical protein